MQCNVMSCRVVSYSHAMILCVCDMLDAKTSIHSRGSPKGPNTETAGAVDRACWIASRGQLRGRGSRKRDPGSKTFPQTSSIHPCTTLVNYQV